MVGFNATKVSLITKNDWIEGYCKGFEGRRGKKRSCCPFKLEALLQKNKALFSLGCLL